MIFPIRLTYQSEFVLTLISTSLEWDNAGGKLLDIDRRLWIKWGCPWPLPLTQLFQKGYKIDSFVTLPTSFKLSPLILKNVNSKT